MGEIIERNNQNKKKKNWNPYHDELFSTLSTDNVDKTIQPYINLLKTSNVKKAIKELNASGDRFDINEEIIESFMKFVDYLLENNRYEELFQQAYSRYRRDNLEIFDKVYNATLSKLGKILSNVKSGKEDLSRFYVLQVIKLLRGDSFIFKLGNGFIWFEKDYLYGEDAKKINEDKSDKPVYGLRMHVGDNAAIYSLKQVFEDMGEFVKTADIGVKPYVGMDSWLLDTDLLKYRLKRKKWTDEEIDYFISNRYGILGEIKLRDIEDPKSYEKAKMRATNHTRDKELVEAYESEGHKLKEGSCLINLNEIK